MKTIVVIIAVLAMAVPALADGSGHGSYIDQGDTRIYEDGSTAIRSGNVTHYSNGAIDIHNGDTTIHYRGFEHPEDTSGKIHAPRVFQPKDNTDSNYDQGNQ